MGTDFCDPVCANLSPSVDNKQMKVATWNVNSIRLRLDSMMDWLKKTDTDVLCVQETKVIDGDFPYGPINDAGYHVAFFGQKSYNGVAILSKHEIEDVQRGFHDD